MDSSSGDEQELFDAPKDRKTRGMASKQGDVGIASIKGRPNIDEISKRNEEEQKRDKRSSYISTGIIALLVIAVMLLIYYFS